MLDVCWGAVRRAANFMTGLCPLIFATVYDNIGNARGQEMLAMTSSVTFLSILAYVPLVALMPKTPKEEKPMELEACATLQPTPSQRTRPLLARRGCGRRTA